MLTSNKQQARSPEHGRPWWRYPFMWMVVGGPASVVVAALYTAGLAIKHVDPVLDTSADHVTDVSQAPAMKARNHAAEIARQPADR